MEFRSDPDIAAWTYFPSLRVLFGLGPGLLETLRDGKILGCRNIFYLGTDTAALAPSPELLLEWHGRHFQFSSKLRELAPTLCVDGTDGHRLHRLEDAGSDGYRLSPAGRTKPRTLAARTDFAVGTDLEDSACPRFTLYRRVRTLKPNWRQKLRSEPETFADWVRGFRRTHLEERLRQLRRTHAAHLEYFGKRDVLNQPTTQHAIRQGAATAVMRRMLGPRGGQQAKSPRVVPVPVYPSRPTDPLPDAIRSTMTEIARQRHGAIIRGENETLADGKTRGKRPYTDLQLLDRALRIAAHREVMAMLHDYALVPIATFSSRGLSEITSGEPVATTPSINP